MIDAQREMEPQGGSTIRLAALPVDDAAREHADSALPFEMISAGADALDACRRDLDNYVAGQTADWDSGMIAVSGQRLPRHDGGGPVDRAAAGGTCKCRRSGGYHPGRARGMRQPRPH